LYNDKKKPRLIVWEDINKVNEYFLIFTSANEISANFSVIKIMIKGTKLASA